MAVRTTTAILWCVLTFGASALHERSFLKGLRGSRSKGPEPGAYFWAGKNGDNQRTGASWFGAPFVLSDGPTWSFHEEPPFWWPKSMPKRSGLVRAAPLIDAEMNIYLSTIAGNVYKMDSDGNRIWKFEGNRTDLNHEVAGSISGVPSIHKGRFFAASIDGDAFALDMQTGKEVWRTKGAADHIAGDTWSVTAGEGVVVIPGQKPLCTDCPFGGNNALIGLNASTGSILWSFKPDSMVYNALTSIKDGSLVFADLLGRTYRLDLKSGALIWKAACPQNMTANWKNELAGTTGGAIIGQDGFVYVTSNKKVNGTEQGLVSSYWFEDGKQRWSTNVEYPANNAPAIGHLTGQTSHRLSLVIGVGVNPDQPKKASASEEGVEPGKGPEHKARVVTLDAETGAFNWKHELPAWHGAAAGDDRIDICLPDSFSNPAIGSDGTVYIGTQSGHAYALSDRDGDNILNADPSTYEVSKFDSGAAFQGSPAIAPGMLVVTPCDGMHVFKFPQAPKAQ